tara:strand:- start:2348 stop:2710 length:363 start_codon:yes stop_codon:yes gene_type:complete
MDKKQIAMGYRSQVIIGIPKEEKENLFKIKNGDRRNVFEDLFSLKLENSQGILIYESIFELKWGSGGYNDVKLITDFLNDLEEREKKVFAVAIGEDQVIHSEIGEYYEYVEIFLSVSYYE